MQKSELRKIFKKKRDALTSQEVAEKSEKIAKNFIKKFFPQNSNKIFSVYLSVENEVRTDFLIKHMKKNQITFSYPKIVKQNQPLEFIIAEKNQIFFNNKLFPKILEPLTGKKISPDFVITPLLAFDHNLSRLGMGGGFFDRTIFALKNQKPETIAIGLAYEFQRLDRTLPIENTDQALDFIITEKSIFSAT